MHCSMSLHWRGNAFFDQDPRGGTIVSKTLTTSLVVFDEEHAYNYTAIISNSCSYKRLVPWIMTLVYIAWAGNEAVHRWSAFCASWYGTRLELRSVDPMANPCPALAVLFGSWMWWVLLTDWCSDPVETNIYSQCLWKSIKEAGIDLPSTLRNALKALKQISGPSSFG